MFVDGKGAFFPEARAAVLCEVTVSVRCVPPPANKRRAHGAMAEFTNTMQKWVKENTRLGIPILFHDECLHGHVAPKGTSYPQAIALASTWDLPPLVGDVFFTCRHRRRRSRARGVQHCLAPVLDFGA